MHLPEAGVDGNGGGPTLIRQLPDGYGVKFVLEEGNRTVVMAEVGPVLLTQPPVQIRHQDGRYTTPPMYQDQVQVVRQNGLR